MYQIIRILRDRQYPSIQSTLISEPMDIKTAKNIISGVSAKNSMRDIHGCTARLVLLPRMHRTV